MWRGPRSAGSGAQLEPVLVPPDDCQNLDRRGCGGSADEDEFTSRPGVAVGEGQEQIARPFPPVGHVAPPDSIPARARAAGEEPKGGNPPLSDAVQEQESSLTLSTAWLSLSMF